MCLKSYQTWVLLPLLPVARNGMNPIDDIRTYFRIKKYFVSEADVILAYTIKRYLEWYRLKRMSKPCFYALITV
jgi:hypothetical protein